MKPYVISAALSLVALTGCSSGHDELDGYIKEVKSRPPGKVKPIPEFAPYETFVYAASGERSPFEPPVSAEQLLAGLTVEKTEVQPPSGHMPQPLERFAITDLTMIGHIEKGAQFWALLQDETGAVHQVRKGDFIGKKYGKIHSISTTTIELVEIVPNGPHAWVERPRTITLIGLN